MATEAGDDKSSRRKGAIWDLLDPPLLVPCPSHQALLLVASLAALLLGEADSASKPQVLIKTKGKVGAPEQDTEEPWGVPSLGRDDELMGLPSWDPEPDRDSLYHPPPEEAQAEAGLRSWSLPPHQELQGPEEDRDHIYHPRDDS
ncbi:proline-rich acidic protein 1 isoform X3 [Panthera tigris]|uniref:proline-rich acidic protein 1 isoform X3 n=1 Tax=Panthera tigris TaxID=9694 RepID=UPI001C6F6613|nr:proline-rich acidic protein 1 isoform X3 [Panthera tigris]